MVSHKQEIGLERGDMIHNGENKGNKSNILLLTYTGIYGTIHT